MLFKGKFIPEVILCPGVGGPVPGGGGVLHGAGAVHVPLQAEVVGVAGDEASLPGLPAEVLPLGGVEHHLPIHLQIYWIQ